ncbi:MAG: TonB family protein [Bacteroidota bacterium]
MTDFKRKIIRDYSPPSDEEISKFMDFSGVNEAITSTQVTAPAGGSGASALLTKGIIALSIAGVGLLYSINYYLNTLQPEPETKADLSEIAIQVSRVGSSTSTINHPDELAFIEFPSAKEIATQTTEKPKPKQPATENKEVQETDNQVVITNRFKDAEPIVGFDSLYAYLRSSLIYPLAPPADTIEGVVEISFVVDRLGEIKKPTILTSMGELFDAEAIRVISNMPKWNPARVNETPLSTKKQIAIQFKRKTN